METHESLAGSTSTNNAQGASSETSFIDHRSKARPSIPRRSSGILLHPTSLPGPFGIGDIGPTAYAWLNTLIKAGQSWWQILPLGPTGQGDSPYSALSAFAGNPLLISPELMVRDGLIAQSMLDAAQFGPGRIEYGHVQKFKYWLLDTAFASFRAQSDHPLAASFAEFCHEHGYWLEDFVLYKALKEAHGNGDWRAWPKPLLKRETAALTAARSQYALDLERHRFRQYLFFKQWSELKTRAAELKITILGDAPIFVAADSADAWANAQFFQFDHNRQPIFVAGVPPDYFSKTGQLWGNPLYDWPAMKRTNYAWWVSRIKTALNLVDVIRLDHFRGFEAAWHIPADADTAVDGMWVKGPGIELFDVLREELGGLPLIAEDLGMITPEVEQLLQATGLPGMKVLQFAFGNDPTAPFLPHNYHRNCVVYTGTHDNDTTVGWYAHLPAGDKEYLAKYAPAAAKDPAGELMRLAWSSVADLAIAPLQDVLRLGNDARMNVPGVPDGNWSWRLTDQVIKPEAFEQLADWTWVYGRRPVVAEAPAPVKSTVDQVGEAAP
jgi:4-alpha-glucanotransferase